MLSPSLSHILALLLCATTATPSAGEFAAKCPKQGGASDASCSSLIQQHGKLNRVQQEAISASAVEHETAPALTKSATGCPCYFNQKKTNCACCNAGACQCSGKSRNTCAPCDAMWKCVVSEDLSAVKDLYDKVPVKAVSALDVALQATKYESQEAGIRAFLKVAYHQPTSADKLKLVALLVAKLKEKHRPSAGQPPLVMEFPNEEEVEQWLTDMFLEEDLLVYANNNRSSKSAALLGLTSRGAEGARIKEKFESCDWRVALRNFYSGGAAYGNWCGKNPEVTGKPKVFQSWRACTGNQTKLSKLGMPVCYDAGFDEACSLHDQTAYYQDVYGIASKVLCKVDGDFQRMRAAVFQKEKSSPGSVSKAELLSVTGAECLYAMMPCVRYESTTRWSWCPSWWGGYPCKRAVDDYVTYWPHGDYSHFTDDACGPTGCYSPFNYQH